MSANGNEHLKREGESELAPFDQKLLIPLDLSRLWQIVIKLGLKAVKRRDLVGVRYNFGTTEGEISGERSRKRRPAKHLDFLPA